METTLLMGSLIFTIGILIGLIILIILFVIKYRNTKNREYIEEEYYPSEVFSSMFLEESPDMYRYVELY